MKIVGQVSTAEEAKELENIVKLFVINGRIKKLADQLRIEEPPEDHTTMILAP